MLAAHRFMGPIFLPEFSNDMYTDFAVDNFVDYDGSGSAVFTDDFNRANGAVGNGWTTDPAVVISSNEVITTANQKGWSRPLTAGDAALDLSFPSGDTIGHGFYAEVARIGADIYYFIIELLASTPTIRLSFAKGPDFSAPTYLRRTGMIDLSRTATWRFTFDGTNYTIKRNGTTLLASGPVYVTDTFTRADSSTALGTADSGQTWVTSNGTLGISSNQGYSPYSAGAFSVGLIDSSHGDVTTQADITFSSSRVNVGLVTRANDYNNCLYAAFSSGSNLLLLLKRVGGVQTVLASVSYAVPLGGTVTTSLIASGAAISVQVNGITKLSYTLTSGENSSFLGSATKQGIEIYTDTSGAGGDDGGSRWDSLSVY